MNEDLQGQLQSLKNRIKTALMKKMKKEEEN